MDGTTSMNQYEPPMIEVLGLYSEQVLCSSNELLEENEGEW